MSTSATSGWLGSHSATASAPSLADRHEVDIAERADEELQTGTHDIVVVGDEQS